MAKLNRISIIIRETENPRDSLVVRERTGTGLAGVWTAGGCVSEVSRGALLTVKPRSVVLAVRTSGRALAGVEVTEVRVGGVVSVRVVSVRVFLCDGEQSHHGDTLPSLRVTEAGVTIAGTFLTYRPPVISPGGEEAGTAELTGAPRVAGRTLTDLNI